jgi:hypothetical protein
MDLGSNDLYLIKKLRESGITLEKLDTYLKKIFLAIKGDIKDDKATLNEDNYVDAKNAIL